MKFTIVILSAFLCLNARANDVSTDDKSIEAIEAAANQLIAEGGRIEEKPQDAIKSEAAGIDAKAASGELKESEIPISIETKKAEKTEGNLVYRMIASLGVVLVVAGAATFAAKKWRHNKDKGGQKARIEIMHQLHLGPKKSIGLIRVAGEALLVGITDQNITMLKTVTLIDDELEGIMGKNFNNFLEDEFSIEDVRSALGPRA